MIILVDVQFRLEFVLLQFLYGRCGDAVFVQQPVLGDAPFGKLPEERLVDHHKTFLFRALRNQTDQKDRNESYALFITQPGGFEKYLARYFKHFAFFRAPAGLVCCFSPL